MEWEDNEKDQARLNRLNEALFVHPGTREEGGQDEDLAGEGSEEEEERDAALAEVLGRVAAALNGSGMGGGEKDKGKGKGKGKEKASGQGNGQQPFHNYRRPKIPTFSSTSPGESMQQQQIEKACQAAMMVHQGRESQDVEMDDSQSGQGADEDEDTEMAEVDESEYRNG